MDWGRAKTILIVSFLILNVMLGYQLWINRWSQTASGKDTADMIGETNKLLDSKKIRVQIDIPKNTPKLSQITVRYREEYRNGKQVKLSKPVGLDTVLNRNFLRDFANKTQISHLDAYRMDASMNRENTYVFHQTYRDLPMFDVTLQLFTENGQITSYKQAYVEVKSGGEPKDKSSQKIISAHAAIRTLAENYLSENAVITDIQLGYHGQLFDSEEQTFVPNWRVTLLGGESYYVHAFTGGVEVAQPVNAKQQ